MPRVALLVVAAGCGRLQFEQVTADGALDSPDATLASLCGPGTTLPFSNTFDTFPAWADRFGTPQNMQIVAGTLQITPDITEGSVAYWSIIESGPSDHRGQRILIEVPMMLDTSTLAQAIFRLSAGSGNWAQLFQSNGALVFETWAGGVTTSSLQVPYDPVAHRWWQLREEAGTLHFEASSDALTWFELRAGPTPSFVAASTIEIAAGYYTMQAASVGSVRFDNLVGCGP